MSQPVDCDFASLIEKRMLRFIYLLDKSGFDYKQYQYEGVKWCISNELRPAPFADTRGGIIADEMGLGKTLMMIGTMFCNFLTHTLIVVPPILLKQWYGEIFAVSGHKALCYYGTNKGKITLEQLNNAPIVLTTYGTLLATECLIKQIGWNRVVYDEAHHLRNSRTKRFISCAQIKARVRWMVTGTPIQNRKLDFHNLCCGLGLKHAFYSNPDNFEAIVKYFVLRRTKPLVNIKLPTLKKDICVVEWGNKREQMLAEELHSLLPTQTGVSSEKQKMLAERLGPGGALVAILRARQSCIYPVLMKEKIINFGLGSEYLEGLKYSSKIDAVISQLVKNKDNGKGKVVFCHYREEIDVVAVRLINAGFKKVICFDGRSSKKIKDQLTEPADALLIQIQTGCEGLNLQKHFSEIYFVSPHWNPAIEDQAIARCHRIGQVEPVVVYKFEMGGFVKDLDSAEDKVPISMETYINGVQNVKRIVSNEMFNL